MLNSYNSKVLLGAGSQAKVLGFTISQNPKRGREGSPGREGHVRRTLDLQIIHASRNSVTSFCNFIIIIFYFRGPLYTQIEPWAQQ